jgi:uncharacterized protein YcfJ
VPFKIEVDMKIRALGALGVATIVLAGCVTPPRGPTIPVMPGPNKNFDAFRQDDDACRDYAFQLTSGGAKEANNKAVASGVIGTVLGAGLGAAVGGGRGAAIGAASGAVVGTAVGANSSDHSQGGLQRQYDIAYAQCMSSKGNQVNMGGPGYGGRRGYRYGPPPAYYPPPPPPPGYYPPPPPPPQ